MTKTKFTPSPWKARVKDSISGARIYSVIAEQEDGRQGVCFLSCGEEAFGNARLIAKAPDMYALLSNAKRELELVIKAYNDMLRKRDTHQDIQPPDCFDYQTCHEIDLLLTQARGEI